MVKNLPANAGDARDTVWSPGLGRPSDQEWDKEVLFFFFFCNQGIHTTCTLTNRGKQIAFFCMRISVYSKIIRINILKRVEILHVLKKILKFSRISQLAEAMTSKVKTERKAFLAKRNCCSSQRSPFNMGLGRKGSLSFLSYREREPGLCLS